MDYLQDIYIGHQSLNLHIHVLIKSSFANSLYIFLFKI